MDYRTPSGFVNPFEFITEGDAPIKLLVPFRDINLQNNSVPYEWRCQKRQIFKVGAPSRPNEAEGS